MMLLAGCAKDDPAPVSTVIKYEIITTAALTTSPAPCRIIYTSGNGADSTDVTFVSGETTWEKSVTVTSATRPLTFKLSTPDGFRASLAGSIKGRIYLNDGIVGFCEESSIFTGGNIILSIPPLQYTLR